MIRKISVQVVMINLLTRYARTNFADPEKSAKPDTDLLLLLTSARPLLQVLGSFDDIGY